MNLVPIINLQTVPHIVHQRKVPLPPISLSFFSLSRKTKFCGWTQGECWYGWVDPETGWVSWDLKYVVWGSHVQIIRLYSLLGQGRKTAVPFTDETFLVKPLHRTLYFLLRFYKKKRGIVYNAVQSGSNFCRVFSVFVQTLRRPCAHWSMDRKKNVNLK